VFASLNDMLIAPWRGHERWTFLLHSFTAALTPAACELAPPEVAAGQAPWQASSDVYAIGAAMYKVAFGTVPLLLPGDSAVTVPTGCDEQLRRLLEGALLLAEAASRPTAVEVLAHPFFGVEPDQQLRTSGAILDVDLKLAALRDYMTEIRSNIGSRRLTLSVNRYLLVESVTSEIMAAR